MYDITTFYAFFELQKDELKHHKAALLGLMEEGRVKGTILVATEGINATLCGEAEPLHQCVQAIKAYFDCEFPETKSQTPFIAFKKPKVRIKPTLVKIGVTLEQPEQVGQYVEPAEWNELITRDDVTVIDTRNSYETYLGSFKGAYDPDTRKFNHLPDILPEEVKVDKTRKIATFCTGGIRCEKYTAWLKDQGYDEVYHLKGGILKYLADIPEEESLWEGSCYVFDDRVAVKHGLELDESVANCPACGHTLTAMDLRSIYYIPNERCRHCATFPPANYDLLDSEADAAPVAAIQSHIAKEQKNEASA